MQMWTFETLMRSPSWPMWLSSCSTPGTCQRQTRTCRSVSFSLPCSVVSDKKNRPNYTAYATLLEGVAISVSSSCYIRKTQTLYTGLQCQSKIKQRKLDSLLYISSRTVTQASNRCLWVREPGCVTEFALNNMLNLALCFQNDFKTNTSCNNSICCHWSCFSGVILINIVTSFESEPNWLKYQ